MHPTKITFAPFSISIHVLLSSGLVKSKNILRKIKEIEIVEFDHKDVVRHPLVSKIVKAYSDQNND